ncbi:helix-turn-helix domain-containing protein [Flavisphingomonas formosensis]|uniref:helix-turn-helix domain-containing protein n=1 Tax=Flavisphingomonas formosensis TaxID=861534 RepID=UPI0038CD2519
MPQPQYRQRYRRTWRAITIGLFRQIFGVSVHRYVEQQRVKRARELLANTDLMLKQIAHQLGLSGASSFCSAFKRATGKHHSPSGCVCETADSPRLRRHASLRLRSSTETLILQPKMRSALR